MGDTGRELDTQFTGNTAIPHGRAAQLETLSELFERLTPDERAEFIHQQFLGVARQPNCSDGIVKLG